MSFNGTFDWVPRGGLTFTPTTQDPNLHIHHGGPLSSGPDPDPSTTTTAPSHYRIQTKTPNPSYLTPPLWIENMMSILSQPSKSLILLESRNGPQKPGFAAPEDVIHSTIKALNLKAEQVKRVIGKSGSLTDYFFSESASTSSDSSVELAFRWTSMPGCYVIFMGRFTPRTVTTGSGEKGKGKEETNRMVGIVSHRGLFPLSSRATSERGGEDEKNKEKKEKDKKKKVIMDSDLETALGKRAEKLGENPMSVFTVLLELCESHLDEEIHELGVRLEGTPMEDFAQVAKEMAPEICVLRKACNDLLAICGGCLFAIKIWSQKVKVADTQTCLDGLRRDVQGIRVSVEMRLEKLNYVDGVCSRMVVGADSGRRNRFMEC